MADNYFQYTCKRILLANCIKNRTPLQAKSVTNLQMVKIFFTFKYGTDGANSYNISIHMCLYIYIYIYIYIYDVYI